MNIHYNALIFILIFLFTTNIAFSEEKKGKAIAVETANINDLLVAKTHSVSAQIVSTQSTQIQSQISAKITSELPLMFEKVTKEQVLIELDCRQKQLNYQQQQQQLDLLAEQLRFSRKQLNRANKLKKDKNISQELIDQYQTNVKQLIINKKIQQNELQQIQLNIDYCIIKAPYDGVISNRYVSKGSVASPGIPLLEIQSFNQLEITAAINEEQQAPEQAVFTAREVSSKVRLQRLSPIISTQSKTRLARYRFIDEEMNNLQVIGKTGYINWSSKAKWLPSHLLIKRNNQYGIFLLNNKVQPNIAEFYPIDNAKPGQQFKINQTIKQAIIIQGQQVIEDKDAVIVISPN